VDDDDAHEPAQRERRGVEVEDRLKAAWHDAALRVEEHERVDADQRRQRQRHQRDDLEGPASRKLDAVQEERQRDPDRPAGDDAHDRDPQARPQRFEVGGVHEREERAVLLERDPARPRDALAERRRNRQDDVAEQRHADGRDRGVRDPRRGGLQQRRPGCGALHRHATT
jgi:hypothetical protein